MIPDSSSRNRITVTQIIIAVLFFAALIPTVFPESWQSSEVVITYLGIVVAVTAAWNMIRVLIPPRYANASITISEGFKRVARTIVRVAVAAVPALIIVLTALPTNIGGFDTTILVAVIGGIVAAVTKVWNAAEDAGKIPAWLRE